ncbi:glycerol kinase [Candidatus Micrarchaeota archaeon]|nr:MAG: glycerol kinase [Candidatus Micrarchaeota archaeon]
MNQEKILLVIDQGTSRTKACLWNDRLELLSTGYCPVEREMPRDGYVEEDPEGIWRSVLASTEQALTEARVPANRIAAVGLANQGESVLAWRAEDQAPLYPAIIWQDLRTVAECQRLASDHNLARLIRERTGLFIHPYFSASKLGWLCRNVVAVRTALRKGTLRLGTLDAWLLARISGGKVFVTDHSTASRTMLFDITRLAWDHELCRIFSVPLEFLPKPVASAQLVGTTDPNRFLGIEAPIAALVCDQPAALLGHNCTSSGDTKCTLGTGAFVLMNIGNQPQLRVRGLLTSLGWSISEGSPSYYLEGGIFFAGALAQWFCNNVGLIENPEEIETISRQIGSTEGVYFVPALSGLAAPHWNPLVRGVILGLSSKSGKAHIARAAMEGVAFRLREIVDLMDQFHPITGLKVDGGVTANPLWMQIIADMLGRPIIVSRVREATALGVAKLAWTTLEGPQSEKKLQAHELDIHAVFQPRLSVEEREQRFRKWKKAVSMALNWQSAKEGDCE